MAALTGENPQQKFEVLTIISRLRNPDKLPLCWVILQMLKKPDDGSPLAYAAGLIRYLEPGK